MARSTQSSTANSFKRDTMDPLQLLLDSKNPRLFGTEAYESDKQDLLLKTMWSFGVSEIVESICENGYQGVEPLFVEEFADGKFVVIEGNRRLTALQILMQPTRAAKLGITGIPPLPAKLLETCKNVPVAIGKREEVWTFIATKHLNGPKTWDSLAKAGYVKYVHEELKHPLEEIARSIGDKNSTILRMYESLKVLEQAETWKIFDRTDNAHKSGELPFSHLYTLFGYDSTRKYLGLPTEFDSGKQVPLKNKAKLKEILVWVFGSKKNNKTAIVRSQNPDLRHLAKALGHERGIAALHAGYQPSVAADIAEGDEAVVLKHLARARDELQNAQRKFSTAYKKGHPTIAVAVEEAKEALRGLLAQKTVIDSDEL